MVASLNSSLLPAISQEVCKCGHGGGCVFAC
jgi:hypothetical protein